MEVWWNLETVCLLAALSVSADDELFVFLSELALLGDEPESVEFLIPVSIPITLDL